MEITKEADFMAWSYKDFAKGEETNSWDKKRQEAEKNQSALGDFQYNKSDLTNQLYNNWQNLQNQGTPTWADQYGGAYNDAMNKILNREKFSYDLNGDALYQQYKDQYTTQGKMAMMDTMGQAAAMTGGYGNSYAQSVGQQTYQGYLQQLNDRVPELYQMALDKYNSEGDELYNQFAMFSDARNQDYGKHRDAVSDYNANLDRAINLYYNQDESDYNRQFNEYNTKYSQIQDAINRADSNYWNSYKQDYSMYDSDRNMSYSDHQFNTQMEYQKEQDAIANQLARDQLNETIRANKAAEKARAASSSGGGGGGGGSGSGNASLFGGFTEAQFTDKMASAFDSKNKTYAQSLVAAAGYTDAAWEIYNMYFGGSDKPVDTTVKPASTGYGNKTNEHKLSLMERRMKTRN